MNHPKSLYCWGPKKWEGHTRSDRWTSRKPHGPTKRATGTTRKLQSTNSRTWSTGRLHRYVLGLSEASCQRSTEKLGRSTGRCRGISWPAYDRSCGEGAVSGLSGSGFPIITVRAAQLCQSASSFSSIKSIQGRRGDQDGAMKKFVATSKGLWTEQGWATWSFEDLQSLLGPFWRYVLFFCPSSTNLTVNFLVRSFCHEFRVVVVRMDVVDPSCSEMMVLMMNHEKNRSPDSTGEQWGKVLRNW